MPQTSGSSASLSWVSATLIATGTGRPVRSVKTWIFEPFRRTLTEQDMVVYVAMIESRVLGGLKV